ncbi:MAG: hypothetical protein OHK0023_09930 [Anaerolineae bacterium]
MINRIWLEQADLDGFDPYQDSADVIVETDDGQVWTSVFVTMPFLQRQMLLTREITDDVGVLLPVRFVALETPHVIVENLLHETVEDVVDNLLTLGTFESIFTLYDEVETEQAS